MKAINCLKTFLLVMVLLSAGFTSASAQQEPKGLLWKISGKGLSQPAYLFGTIHLYDTSSYELPQAAFDVLNQVDKIYFELDFGNINTQEMLSGLYISDSTQYIDKQLDAASMERLKQFAKQSPLATSLGNKLYTIKPMLLISMLTSTGGKASSVDLELYKAALGKQLPVGGLETVKEQMDVFNVVSISSQLEMLRQMLSLNLSPVEMITRMTAIYVKQDIAHLLTEMNNNMPLDANFNEALLVKRNIVMADRIESALKNTHPLIAVGAGHLDASTGLVALLRQKGYTLTNIPFTIKKVHE